MCGATYPGLAINKNVEQRMFDKVLSNIRTKMIKEEGIKYIVYLDSLDKPTGGIGHLITPEDNMEVGQTVSTAQINEWFLQDVSGAIWAAIGQSKEVGEFEIDFVKALTSVNFQLGVNWPIKWPNTYKALKAGKLETVINNVMKSLWNKQTPKRTQSFRLALLQEIAENNQKVVT